jgi:hypothetical protein
VGVAFPRDSGFITPLFQKFYVDISQTLQTNPGTSQIKPRSAEGDPDIDGRIILRWIFRKLEVVVGTGWSWLRIGTGSGHL